MDQYENRKEAGRILGKLLLNYKDNKQSIVFALPRGGVPVGFEIAKMLNIPLDVIVVRKLGVPFHEELAMGAIASGGVHFYNEDIVRELNISSSEIKKVLEKELKEVKRREILYRGDRPAPHVFGMNVILVDDGIATGATMKAAISALRKMKVGKLIVAVPVAQRNVCNEIKLMVDELICPMQPIDFYAVGLWYRDFSQTEDEEVFSILKHTV